MLVIDRKYQKARVNARTLSKHSVTETETQKTTEKHFTCSAITNKKGEKKNQYSTPQKISLEFVVNKLYKDNSYINQRVTAVSGITFLLITPK